MKCKKCNLKIKENKDGVKGYCQGHSAFDFAPESPKPYGASIEKRMKRNKEILFPM